MAFLWVFNEISHQENLYSKENTVKKSQDKVATPDHRYAPTVSPRYPKDTKANEDDLQSNIIKQIETIKEDLNKSLKEVQENTFKQLEAFKEEPNK